ncbi:hypothetical protein GCM10009731_05880 [Streptomyces globosus]
MPPRLRVCADPSCDHVYTATNKFCTRHRMRTAICKQSGCGREFTSAGGRYCSRHRYPERECLVDGCTHRFRASNRICSACRETFRECASDGCDTFYKGNARHCRACLTPERTCAAPDCLTVFRGTTRLCWEHRAVDRTCEADDCENTYRGTTLLCLSCRTVERECIKEGCTTVYWGDRAMCNDCRMSDRICPDCEREFRGRTTRCGPCWWAQIPADVRSAISRASGNAYRARKLAAQVAGPVPAAEYERIRTEALCVYCGGAATEVDHIRPLATHGGWEHISNLVPACRSCNASKSDRLLTEWDQVRVFRAVRASEKVAVEYECQRQELVGVRQT